MLYVIQAFLPPCRCGFDPSLVHVGFLLIQGQYIFIGWGWISSWCKRCSTCRWHWSNV